MKSITEMLSFFWKYQKSYKLVAVGAAAALVLTELLRLPMPFITRYLIDDVIPSADFGLLHLFCGLLLLSMVIKQVALYILRILLITFKTKVHRDIELDLYLHIQELPMSFFIKNPPGYLLSRISETSSANALMADTLMFLIKDFLTMIVGIIAILYLHLTIGLMTLAVLPFFIFSLNYFHGKLKALNKILYEKSAKYTEKLEKNLHSIEKIKTSVKEEREGKRVADDISQLVTVRISNGKLNTVATAVASAIALIPPLLVLYYGVSEIMKGHLTLGTFVAINSFVATLFGPAQNLTEVGYKISKALAGLERVYDVFKEPVEDNGGIQLEKLAAIRFKNVSFSYVKDNPVLRDVDFEIPYGQKLALIGKSGEGKSTIVKMMMKLLRPTGGQVLFSGVDIETVERKSLRRKIAYISQASCFLDAEIAEGLENGNTQQMLKNFHLALEGKKYFREEMSGGETQRLEVVEALLKTADVLIVDEGTSNLDYEFEKYVMKELMTKYKHKTVIFIAHRLHSISDFDRILVLEKGIIREDGNHRQLMEQQGRYWHLWEKQSEPVF
ncbi:MAG: ABC transporter ATP-binding protein [bacterium]|nr:ABC transporter ATP-binding protein [bacterium]